MLADTSWARAWEVTPFSMETAGLAIATNLFPAQRRTTSRQPSADSVPMASAPASVVTF